MNSKKIFPIFRKKVIVPSDGKQSLVINIIAPQVTYSKTIFQDISKHIFANAVIIIQSE